LKSNKKSPQTEFESLGLDSHIKGFESGEGGIRTHGTVAGTLVFKASS